MQDAKQQCLFKDIQLDDTSPKGLGGNIHNEYLSRDEVVDIFKAVSVERLKLCNNGDYVAYHGEEEVK